MRRLWMFLLVLVGIHMIAFMSTAYLESITRNKF